MKSPIIIIEPADKNAFPIIEKNLFFMPNDYEQFNIVTRLTNYPAFAVKIISFHHQTSPSRHERFLLSKSKRLICIRSFFSATLESCKWVRSLSLLTHCEGEQNKINIHSLKCLPRVSACKHICMWSKKAKTESFSFFLHRSTSFRDTIHEQSYVIRSNETRTLIDKVFWVCFCFMVDFIKHRSD